MMQDFEPILLSLFEKSQIYRIPFDKANQEAFNMK